MASPDPQHTLWMQLERRRGKGVALEGVPTGGTPSSWAAAAFVWILLFLSQATLVQKSLIKENQEPQAQKKLKRQEKETVMLFVMCQCSGLQSPTQTSTMLQGPAGGGCGGGERIRGGCSDWIAVRHAFGACALPKRGSKARPEGLGRLAAPSAGLPGA